MACELSPAPSRSIRPHSTRQAGLRQHLAECGGKGEAILYYTIDGRPEELSRDISVTYTTLEWNDDRKAFVEIEVEKRLSHIAPTVMVTPPLYCNSRFHLSGDRFLKQWGIPVNVESPEMIAGAVAVHTEAEQTNLPDFGIAGGSSSSKKKNDGGGTRISRMKEIMVTKNRKRIHPT